MYDQLLKIKQYREDQALSDLENCRFACEQAEQALLEGREKLAEFKSFRQAEKARLFDELKNEQVAIKKVDEMNRQVALLKEQELEHIQQCETLRQNLEESQQALENAKLEYHKASLEVNKYEELCRQLDQEQSRDAERREELERESVPIAGGLKALS